MMIFAFVIIFLDFSIEFIKIMIQLNVIYSLFHRKITLKGVLLHNCNIKPSVPVGHAPNSKETFGTMSTLIDYERWNWKMFGDFKVIGLLLGLRNRYNKYSSFLCHIGTKNISNEWKWFHKKKWPIQNKLVPGKINKYKTNLMNPQNKILSPFHIKIGSEKTVLLSNISLLLFRCQTKERNFCWSGDI